jgi:hypothetical protein
MPIFREIDERRAERCNILREIVDLFKNYFSYDVNF